MTGLWHGASWNFVVWGLYHGLFLIIERLGFGEKILAKWPRFFRHLYTILIVMIGWVFFRADTLSDAIIYIKGMFVPFGMDVPYFQYIMNGQYWLSLVVGVLFAIPYPKAKEWIVCHMGQWALDGVVLLIFLVAICYMVGSGYSPFLYFRF